MAATQSDVKNAITRKVSELKKLFKKLERVEAKFYHKNKEEWKDPNSVALRIVLMSSNSQHVTFARNHFNLNKQIITKCYELYLLLSNCGNSPIIQELCQRFEPVVNWYPKLPLDSTNLMVILKAGIGMRLEILDCYIMYCTSKDDFKNLLVESIDSKVLEKLNATIDQLLSLK